MGTHWLDLAQDHGKKKKRRAMAGSLGESSWLVIGSGFGFCFVLVAAMAGSTERPRVGD